MVVQVPAPAAAHAAEAVVPVVRGHGEVVEGAAEQVLLSFFMCFLGAYG